MGSPNWDYFEINWESKILNFPSENMDIATVLQSTNYDDNLIQSEKIFYLEHSSVSKMVHCLLSYVRLVCVPDPNSN